MEPTVEPSNPVHPPDLNTTPPISSGLDDGFANRSLSLPRSPPQLSTEMMIESTQVEKTVIHPSESTNKEFSPTDLESTLQVAEFNSVPPIHISLNENEPKKQMSSNLFIPTKSSNKLLPQDTNENTEQPKSTKRKVRRMSIGAALMMPPEPRVNAKMDFKTLLKFTLTALGILYGDMATSPMFVFKSAFRSGFLSEETYELEVICCLSFIIWITLLLGVAKYCFVVLRADNYGEGGMLALFCSIPHPNEDEKVQIALEKYYPWIYSLALLGCAFILGDGMIVPAISMLAALEGFHSIEHGHPEYFSISVKSWITPSACAFLFCLFSVQRFGLGKVSWIFPPILIVWCLALFCIGVAQLVTLKTPLNAFCPWYMIRSVQEFGVAYTLSKLSIVLLVVAGMEFFYADLGAFKRRPMTISYTMIVVPSILSSYLGQASFLLQMQKENHVDQILNDLFFESSPSWLRWPLVILGMLVSAVGSQSVLSGCFALLDQAITLRALPPFLSKHLLAGDNHGTYFVPFFNFIFFLGSLLLAIVFKDSVVLSDLFGLCVSGAMLITSILTMIVMYVRWNTKVYWIVGYCVILMLDIIVFIAALTKLTSNAYISLFFSIAIFVIMYTYKSTCDNIDAALEDSLWTTAMTRQHLRQNPRIDGLGVFISNSDEEIPHVLSLLASKLTSLPKNVVVVTTNCMRSIPFVASEDRLNFRCVDPQQGLYRILLTHGFAERPMPISIALLMAEKRGLRLHKNLTYFVSRIIIYVHSQARWYQRWRYYVFEVLTRNVQQRDQALQLPPHQVMWVSSILELK